MRTANLSGALGADEILSRRIVRAACRPDNKSWRALAALFENVLPVTFCFDCGAVSRDDQTVKWDAFSPRNDGLREEYLGSFSFPASDKTPVGGEPKEIIVHFADAAEVPFPLRGRVVKTKVLVQPEKIVPRVGERILAASGQVPLWTVSNESGASHFRSGFALPAANSASAFKDVFSENHFLELLPLMHWLRQACAKETFGRPPLRACFIFDDPNLHWPSYGYVNYRQIAARAKKNNYHVSFATIPLDTWFTHQPTAEIFRKNPACLSLSVHGNDHLKQELSRPFTQRQRVGLLKQAAHRIVRLERKADLPVCRVIVPPHGACSAAMLGEMPNCGFEAACISHGSLRAHNPEQPWVHSLGYLPSETIEGCPVMPRWAMTADPKSALLMAAFLGQPLVLRGHHQDLKNGVELLDELAQFINGLGSVNWSNLTGLCRGNYQWRMSGEVCMIKPLSRKIHFPVPDATAQMLVQSPQAGFVSNWRVIGADETKTVVSGERFLPPNPKNGVLEIALDSRVRQPVPVDGEYKLAPGALVRRLLTEARDRFFSFS